MFAIRLRRSVTVVTTLLFTLLVTTATAHADVPTGWTSDTTVSFWDYVVVLVLIPGALAATIIVVCLAAMRGRGTD
ncbi:hypothetical protein BH09ACT11_BH09ACT11_01750 [soil metagenome]